MLVLVLHLQMLQLNNKDIWLRRHHNIPEVHMFTKIVVLAKLIIILLLNVNFINLLKILGMKVIISTFIPKSKEDILRKIYIFFLLILFSILGGCSQVSEPDNKAVYESFEQPIAEVEDVFTLGLYNGQDFEYERTFEINDDPFQKDLVLGNKTSEKSSFILVIFNHGKQIEFKVEDKITNKYSFDVEPDEYHKMDISFSDIEDGFHSITYVLLDNPEEFPQDYETAMDLSNIFSVRVNLFKNINSIPDERPELVANAIKSDTRNIHGVLLSDEKEKYKVLFNEPVKENQKLPVKLNYGNANSESMDFYMVSLLNFEQVPINDAPYLYDALGSDEEKELSFDINSHSLNHKNNSYQFIMLPTPFKALTDEDPFLLQDPLASNRATLIRE
uniref:Uncharacterized protein n=2 Tax=Planococcus citreus TaxID=1373 RepID=K7XUH5_9BACL|nr:hypothetical protein [Planococcus citreus]